MKQLVFTIKTSLILILSVIAFSCCQQEDDGIHLSKSAGNLRYLTVEPGFLSCKEGCFPDSNYTNLYEAFGRIIDYKNHHIIKKVEDAQKANVSTELFNYFDSLIDEATTRASSNNNGSDCTAHTIATIYCELFGNATQFEKKIYEAGWKYICNHYNGKGVEWDEQGYNYLNMLKCSFDYVSFTINPKAAPYKDTMDKVDDQFLYRLIAVIKEDDKTYHTVTVLCIAGNGLFCRDEQKNKTNRIVENSKIIALYHVGKPKLPGTAIRNLESK